MQMKWRRTQEGMGSSDIDLTPLIDMVFILLIFFIVSTSFIRESGIVVERPAASTGESQTVQVIIGIDKDNIIWIEGKTIDIRTITSRMKQFKAENEKLAVIVAADVQANAGILIKVLDMCRLADVQDISVATEDN